jgi:hypothetical protein
MNLVFFSQFQLSTLDMLEFELCNFFMKLSRSHDSGREFNRLTQIDLGFFFFF